MNKMIRSKLETLKRFQERYPTSHVGGSIGLMLRGVDLQRDLSKSDLDITVDEFTFSDSVALDYEERSDNNDFDFSIKETLGDGIYVKIDVRVCPEPSFEQVTFEGITYNVSKLRDILYWKKVYASKKSEKHIDDLKTIETGIRPVPKNIPSYAGDTPDDLPF